MWRIASSWQGDPGLRGGVTAPWWTEAHQASLTHAHARVRCTSRAASESDRAHGQRGAEPSLRRSRTAHACSGAAEEEGGNLRGHAVIGPATSPGSRARKAHGRPHACVHARLVGLGLWMPGCRAVHGDVADVASSWTALHCTHQHTSAVYIMHQDAHPLGSPPSRRAGASAM